MHAKCSSIRPRPQETEHSPTRAVHTCVTRAPRLALSKGGVAPSPGDWGSRWPQPGAHATATQGSRAGSLPSVEQGPAVTGASRPSAPCTHVTFRASRSAPQADEHAPDPSCLPGQGCELQVSTSAGCWARALHRAGGSILRRPPWASMQRTSRSRRPPPHEALHWPKSPAAQ